MFGLEELKKKIEIQGDTIVCPVIGCETQVKKMTKGVLKSLDAYLEKGEDKRIPRNIGVRSWIVNFRI